MKKVEEIYSCHASSKQLQFNKKIIGGLTKNIPHNTVVFSQEFIRFEDLETINDISKNLQLFSQLLHIMITDFLDRKTTVLANSKNDIIYSMYFIRQEYK